MTDVTTFGILVSPYVVREDEENHVSRFLHGQNILRGNNIAMYEVVVKVEDEFIKEPFYQQEVAYR